MTWHALGDGSIGAYRLEEIEEIKAAVKETIALHLGSQPRARSPR
ncbi:MAG TPA: hypothetical protein VHG30_02510 [Microvirga sp.]|nr:hypothetical protein [Microvirga sp.]